MGGAGGKDRGRWKVCGWWRRHFEDAQLVDLTLLFSTPSCRNTHVSQGGNTPEGSKEERNKTRGSDESEESGKGSPPE